MSIGSVCVGRWYAGKLGGGLVCLGLIADIAGILILAIGKSIGHYSAAYLSWNLFFIFAFYVPAGGAAGLAVAGAAWLASRAVPTGAPRGVRATAIGLAAAASQAALTYAFVSLLPLGMDPWVTAVAAGLVVGAVFGWFSFWRFGPPASEVIATSRAPVPDRALGTARGHSQSRPNRGDAAAAKSAGPGLFRLVREDRVVGRFVSKYAVFSGRTRREEYWGWLMVNFVVWTLGVLLGSGLGGEGAAAVVSILLFAWFAATIVPHLALTVRRLHDANLSGWFVLLYLVPIPLIGGLSLLALTALPSKPLGVRFDRPKAS
ncbi:DUF805 domain-containing protein [Sinomonas sp. ASV322]|uniref:DUF805 domain-containing protein n=1 Tax=Sinomonas sp. ASV322 TaxID=3041920 RepID=UPI0027DE8B26|nr:DUF805 domain-containing protein [Sinomonas sp. ASV322]MDQ4502353.1 DUF805 domain-containing protein [Sinomonas sp. ASV322]